jgi:YHS domain-containing protein
MKSIINRKSLLSVLAILSLLAVSALAQDAPQNKKEEHQGHHNAQSTEKSTAEKTQDPQKGEKQFLGKGDGIETCPVTGEPIDKEFKSEINGRIVYVCCPGCLDTIKEDPDLYLKKDSGVKKEEKQEVKPEEKKEEKFLGKGDGIETCPVMGMPVDKEVKAEINGRIVYACCPGCLETIKANPELYLKKTEKTDKTEKK